MMQKVSLWDLFLAFLKIGAFTIGGGYVMIPAIQDEMSRRGWIAEDELPDIVALAQAAPGLLTVNMSIFAGYRLRGVAGSVVATAGVILVPFVIILLIAMFFSSIRENIWVEKAFNGVRPAAVGLVAAYFISLLKKNSHWWDWAIASAALVAVSLLEISPIWIVLVVIVVAASALYVKERRSER